MFRSKTLQFQKLRKREKLDGTRAARPLPDRHIASIYARSVNASDKPVPDADSIQTTPVPTHSLSFIDAITLHKSSSLAQSSQLHDGRAVDQSQRGSPSPYWMTRPQRPLSERMRITATCFPIVFAWFSTIFYCFKRLFCIESVNYRVFLSFQMWFHCFRAFFVLKLWVIVKRTQPSSA